VGQRAVAALAATAVLAIASPGAAMNDGPGLTRVPYDTSQVPLLTCSVGAGCEVILGVGERLKVATLMDDRWTARVEDPGSADTAPRIVISPSVADEVDEAGHRKPLMTQFHAVTLETKREYVVNLQATSRFETHRLGFTYKSAPAQVIVVQRDLPMLPRLDGSIAAAGGDATPVPVESPISETPPLDPARMDFGWQQTGDAGIRCVTVFSYGSQIWCKMRSNLLRVPSAYIVDGSKLEPVNAHPVAQRYLVVDSVIAPLRLVLAGSPQLTVTIQRGPE
jgi:hypothetical protein